MFNASCIEEKQTLRDNFLKQLFVSFIFKFGGSEGCSESTQNFEIFFFFFKIIVELQSKENVKFFNLELSLNNS